MGIIHVRPWETKRYGWKPKRGRKDGQGLRIERNRQGILYFRQPRGEDDFTTWHIDIRGEGLIREWGITVGQCLPPKLVRLLRENGCLYTISGTRNSDASNNRNRPTIQQNHSQSKSGQGNVLLAAKQGRSARGRSNQTVVLRNSVNNWMQPQTERNRRWSTGRLHVVLKPPAKNSRSEDPSPISNHHAQLAASASWRKCKNRGAATRVHQQRGMKAGKTETLDPVPRSKASVPQIHPGWLKPADPPRAVQLMMFEIDDALSTCCVADTSPTSDYVTSRCRPKSQPN